MSRRSMTQVLRTRAARRLVAATSAGALLVGAIAGCGGGDTTASASGYQVRALFDSAAFVIPGLDVKIAGVKVGKVEDVQLTDDNRAAITFNILTKGFQDLRKDAHCAIRPQALIGERFIECTLTELRPDGATPPAKIPAAQSGPFKGMRLLPLAQTSVPVDADEVLSANNGSTRDRFGIIIRELGAGLAGRGPELNKTLRRTNEGLRVTNQFLKKLSEQRSMLVELAENSDRTVSSLAAERSSITGAIENGATVNSTLAARRTELKGTIRELNGFLRETPAAADKVTELTDELSPIAKDLNRSSSDLATILTDLPEVTDRGATALTALSPTINKAREVFTTNDPFFDRIVRSSSAIKASTAVLGATLSDFRSDGGLDYFLDAIYGLTFATNGRDQTGSYLRAAAVNYLTCALRPARTGSGSCINTLAVEAARVSASDSAGADESARPADEPRSTTPDSVVKTTPRSASSKATPDATSPTTAGTTPQGTSPKATTPNSTTPNSTTPGQDSDAVSADLLLGGGR